MRHSPSNKSRRGFTLMELLVAMGITALIVTVLVAVTSIALDAWRRGRAEVRASRQAKAALDTMARDFESMLVRGGNNYHWLFARVEPNLAGKPDATGAKNKIPNAAQIVFFNSATDRYDGMVGNPAKDLGGDVTATGYRLVYRDQIGNREATGTASDPSVFALYRHLVDPKPTFDKLLAKKHQAADTDAGQYKEDPLRTAWEADFAADDTDPGNFLVENIYEITVTFTVEYQTTTTPAQIKTQRYSISPERGGNADDTRVSEFRIAGEGLWVVNKDGNDPVLVSGRVIAVDFAITVLSDFGIQMAKRANISTAQLVREHGFHYAKSVSVPQS